MRGAFDSPAAVVEEHWSGALNIPENRPLGEGASRASHDLIRWDQAPTYDGAFVTFRGTLLGDAVLEDKTLADARAGGGPQNFTLSPAGDYTYAGAILPPLLSGRWILDDPGDVVAGEYGLEGRTFTIIFRFPQGLDAASDYAVLVWGFPDASRTPFASDSVDVLGYARIRAE